MHLRLAYLTLAILIAGIGIWTVILIVQGRLALAGLGPPMIGGLVALGSLAARKHRGEPTAVPPAGPKSATAPPDGHIRFTLVVEGLEPTRIATVWADLCRPDRAASEDLKLLFRNFTLVDGSRFRFLKGDPTTTAAVLSRLLGTAAGVPVRTALEPAAERTPPWS